jgi:hypothetical protein
MKLKRNKKVGQTILTISILLLSIICSQAKNNTELNQRKDVLLFEALDELAEAYQISIIYDILQLEKVKLKQWKLSKISIEYDLKNLLKKI